MTQEVNEPARQNGAGGFAHLINIRKILMMMLCDALMAHHDGVAALANQAARMQGLSESAGFRQQANLANQQAQQQT